MSENKIMSLDNGPYLVSGNVTITDADGTAYEIDGETAALCRCGHSGNKPFCDGTHKAEDFSAVERAGA